MRKTANYKPGPGRNVIVNGGTVKRCIRLHKPYNDLAEKICVYEMKRTGRKMGFIDVLREGIVAVAKRCGLNEKEITV